MKEPLPSRLDHIRFMAKRVRPVNPTMVDQCREMVVSWPCFKKVDGDGNICRWRGTVQPISKSYLVAIDLKVVMKNRKRHGYPSVRVLNPLLTRRIDSPDEQIPHIYLNRKIPELPDLCLYDPCTSEWNQSSLVADTIVPWTIDWLACYEIWHLSGTWEGGGRHP